MAIIATSPLISNLRGKAGPCVFTTYQGKTYLRGRTKPINHNNPVTSNWRSIVSSFFKTWQQLGEEARAGYNDIAPSIPFYDINGNNKSLSGYNLFVKCALNAAICGNSAITAYPDNSYCPIMKNFRIEGDYPVWTVTWDNYDPLITDYYYVAYISFPTTNNSPKSLNWLFLNYGNYFEFYNFALNPSVYFPFISDGFGPVNVFVKAKLINKFSFLSNNFQFGQLIYPCVS